jgi:hypothetical protein
MRNEIETKETMVTNLTKCLAATAVRSRGLIQSVIAMSLLVTVAHARFEVHFDHDASGLLSRMGYGAFGEVGHVEVAINYTHAQGGGLMEVGGEFEPYVSAFPGWNRSLYFVEGQDFFFEPGLISVGDTQISWILDDGLLDGESSPVLVLPSAGPNLDGVPLILRVVNGGTTYDFSYWLYEQIAPVISLEPEDLVILPYGLAEFSVEVEGSWFRTYQWYEVGVGPLPASRSSTLDLGWVDVADSGRSFFVEVSFELGVGSTTISRAATLSVQTEFATELIGVPDVIAVWPGHATPFYQVTVNVSGEADIRWEYSVDGLAWGPIFEIGNEVIYEEPNGYSAFLWADPMPASAIGGFFRLVVESVAGNAISGAIPIQVFGFAESEEWGEQDEVVRVENQPTWQSPDIEPGESAVIFTYMRPPYGEGQLRFFWQAVPEVEVGGALELLVNGTVVRTYQGAGAWVEERVDLSSFSVQKVSWRVGLNEGSSFAGAMGVAHVDVIGFAAPAYRVRTTAVGGVIHLDPDEDEYAAWSNVEATAEADQGMEFTGWSGATGSILENPITFTIFNEMDLTANFAPIFQPELIASPGLEFVRGGSSLLHQQEDLVRPGRSVALSMTSDYAWIETTLSAPGTFAFWWYGTGSTFFQIQKDGHWLDTSSYDTASDSDGWSRVVTKISEGGTVIRLSFFSYDNSAIGLDGISFSPGGGVPLDLVLEANGGTILVDPEKPFYEVGDLVTLTAVANTGLVFAGWSGDLEGTTNPQSLVMSEDRLVTAHFGIAFDSAQLSPSGLVFTSGGDSDWVLQGDITRTGRDFAARSGEIGDHGFSWMETSVIGPGALSYWRKVSSEREYDSFQVFLNGIAIEVVSGEVEWGQEEVEIPEGPHVVRWEYSKDGSVSAGLDAAFVDEVVFVSAGEGFGNWPVLSLLPPDRRGPLDRNGALGLVNLLAYAMGLNPLNVMPSDMPSATVFSEVERTVVRFRYRRAKNAVGVTLIPLVTPDLVNWVNPEVLTSTVVGNGGDWEIVEIEVLLIPGGSMFFKLFVDEIKP